MVFLLAAALLTAAVAEASAQGLPIFVTEYGVTAANGGFPRDLESADLWVELLERERISYCMWTFSKVAEPCSAVRSTVPKSVTVNWIINPSDGGVYQQKLDEALLNQANAADDEKVDMFLAEADYIGKYVNSDATMGIDAIGFKNAKPHAKQAKPQ